MTTPLAAWRDIAIRYPGAAADAVGPVSLAVARGERVLLLGPSGCGKSSLLLALTGLIPHAVDAAMRGARQIAGQSADTRSPAEWADTVALLTQAPERNLCGMTVAEEIGFALEQSGLPATTIRARVARACAAAGFDDAFAARRVAALSGGQQQRVAVAAALAQDARLLLVDEPTAHLDDAACAFIARALATLGSDRGALIVDHRLDGLIDAIDRVAVLDADGRLAAEGPPRRVFRERGARLAASGVWRPAAAELDDRLTVEGVAPDAAPLTVAELATHIGALTGARRRRAETVADDWLSERSGPARRAEAPAIRLRGVDCAAPNGQFVLRDVDLTLYRGQVTALMGANGAGKTTLALALAGLTPIAAGRRDGGVAAMAFQNPEAVFLGASAGDELAASGLAPREAAAMLNAWGLGGLETRHPLDLSQGQKRRLALAAAVALTDRALIVLDEPTAGLDAAATAALTRRIGALAEEGRAVALVTHDADLARAVADRIVALRDGAAAVIGGPDALDDPALRARWGLPAPTCAPLRRLFARELASC